VTARTVAWILAVAVGAYLLFTAARSWALIASGDPVPILLGISVIAFPVIGAWVIGRELVFGLRSQALGRELGAEGGLPVDDLPRTPSGRIERDAADARFAEYQAQAEIDPDDWRRWYRLAIAYDDARDRKRARAAMRKAIALHRQSS
jgi:tetratricopeptide (TPR) repeat protein